MSAAPQEKKLSFPKAFDGGIVLPGRGGGARGPSMKGVKHKHHGRPFEGCTPEEMVKINAIVGKNQGLAHKVAMKVWQRCPDADFDEVLSACMLTLGRCARAFRPELGFRFSTFAWPSLVRGARAIIDRQIRYRNGQSRRLRTVALDPKMSRPAVTVRSVLSSLVAEEERQQMIAWARTMLELPNERWRVLLRMRVLEEHTLDDVAKVIGVSRERVRQVERDMFFEIMRRWREFKAKNTS